MNNKTLIALLGIGLIPSLLFGQLYRMDIDAQQAGQERVIDRVFTGNTVGLDVGFYDGATPILMTNWTVMFQYYDGQYSTNSPVQIKGVSSGNRVIFDSTSNVFYSASENYYFSIAGVDAAGRKRTFARGRMIEEYDPGTAGSVGVSSNGLYFVSWANIFGDPGSNSNLVEYVAMHGGEFGSDAVARAGVASNAADIATLQTNLNLASNSLSARIGAVQTNLNTASNALYQLAGVVNSTVITASNSLSFRIGLEETNRATAVGTVQTNLNAVSNFSAQANAKAIAAHAAVSNLPPIPTTNSLASRQWVQAHSINPSELVSESNYVASITGQVTLATNTPAITISNLLTGSAMIEVVTTNAENASECGIDIFDSNTNLLAAFMPACDGSTQQISFAYSSGQTLTFSRSSLLPSTATNVSPPILTSMRVWTLLDTTVSGRTNDLANQVLLVDDPSTDRQAANKLYADRQRDSAISTALAETWSRSRPTSLNDNDLAFGVCFVLREEGENLNLYYRGILFHTWAGGGTILPKITSIVFGTNITLNVSASTSGIYQASYSTDVATWTPIATNATTQVITSDKTLSLSFSNPAPSASSLYFRVAAATAPTTTPKSRSIAAATVGTNDAILATQPWVVGYLATNASGTGTVLYYNVTADSTAIGNAALARTNGTAVGTAAWADTYGAALGDTAYAPRSGAAIGADTIATDYGVAVGRGATAQHTNVAIGAGAQATGHNSVSIGAGAINDMDNTVLLGNTETTQTVARGTLAVGSIALGTSHPTSVWPQGGTTNIFTGAGTTGLVASASGDTNKFLRGDGTWQEVQAGTAGGITSLVVNGYAVPQTNGQAYLSITTSGGIYASNTPGNVELFLSSFPAWAGVGSNRVSFVYVTNAPQFFTVPSGVTNMAAWIWGGGANNFAGGSTFITFPVVPGENLELRVPNGGTTATITNSFFYGYWPGGGDGYAKGAATVGGGGGYSAILRGTNLVAVSGGGTAGGIGGGISGGTTGGIDGKGGTQVAGGAPGSTNQTAGSFLHGGSATTNATAMGGGGGYFGGGAGPNYGGGGSGFVNTSIGAVGYTFRGLVGSELPEYITGKGGPNQSGLIVLGY